MISDLFFTFPLRYFESHIDTYVKGHYVYKNIWTPETGESLDAQIQSNYTGDKYAVCLRQVMRHLKKGATGRFPKTIFFFLKGDPYSKGKTITSARRCNLCDGKGLQISCKL